MYSSLVRRGFIGSAVVRELQGCRACGRRPRALRTRRRRRSPLAGVGSGAWRSHAAPRRSPAPAAQADAVIHLASGSRLLKFARHHCANEQRAIAALGDDARGHAEAVDRDLWCGHGPHPRSAYATENDAPLSPSGGIPAHARAGRRCRGAARGTRRDRAAARVQVRHAPRGARLCS